MTAKTWRKIAIWALLGGVVGYGVGRFLAMDGVKFDGWEAPQIILAAVGAIYLVMGLITGAGVILPKSLGAKMLNVADAEEIAEEFAKVSSSAVCCVGFGAALLLLAQSTTAAALVSPAMAYGILIAVLIAAGVMSIMMWPRFDELWRQLCIDSYAITGALLICLGTIWGGAAAAELVGPPHPLDLVSASFGLFLLATFIAAGRRGMIDALEEARDEARQED